MTQRSRGDKRHPLALARILRAPRPLTSLQRPPRTPRSLRGQSFPCWARTPTSGRLLSPHTTPAPVRGPSPPHPAPSPPARSLWGAPGRWGPAASLTRCPPGRGARVRAGAAPGRRPVCRTPPIAPPAGSPLGFAAQPRAQGAAERSAPRRSEAANPAPRPPRPLRPALAAPGQCGARPPAREAGQYRALQQHGHPNFLSAFRNIAGGGRGLLTRNAVNHPLRA